MQAVPINDSSIQLSDGRSLAYCEWGTLDGPAVLAFHGSPGSRLWWPAQDVTKSAGARLVTVDRPGYGGSTPHPDRTVRDWFSDVTELTRVLGIERFGVVGWSGGAPYAAAIAAEMPSRLTGACLVCSASLTYILDSIQRDPEDLANLEAVERLGVVAATEKYAAGELSEWSADLRKDPERIVDFEQFAEGDRWLLEDPIEWQGFLEGVREAFRGGSIGAATDWIAVARPWGFSCEDIQMPVSLWHGGQDPGVDFGDFEQVANDLPNGHLKVWPDVGHFGPAKYWDEVLDAALG